MDWFKYFHDALDDPKVQTLDGETFKRWVNILCVASKQPRELRGTLPDLSTLALKLRLSLDDTKALVTVLRKAKLLDQGQDRVLRPHNWQKRQARKPSDEPARVLQRVTKARNAQRNAHVTPSIEEGNAAVSRYRGDTARQEGESEEDSESPPLNPPQPAEGAAVRAPDKPAQERGVRSAPVDALWTALDRECGKAATKSEIQVRVRVHRELADVQATPEQIRSRAKAWHQRYPSTTLTDLALAKHWSSLGPKTPSSAAGPATEAVPAVPVPEREPTPEERERQREHARRFLLPQLRKAKATKGGLSPALLASATPWFSPEELTEFSGGSAA